MFALGTIVNVAAIVAGGLIGILFGRFIKERYQEMIVKATGISVMFLGATESLSKLLYIAPDTGTLETQKTLMMILAIVLGTVVGEILNIERLFEKFGEFLKRKSGSSADNRFSEAFLTASFTVCIGAMAIIGSIEDGIHGDPTILFAKSILDFIIVMMMAASMGKGCVFSAIPVGLLQGGITLLARWIAPLMTDTVLHNLSLTGNILIFCVGLNLVYKKTVRVANMLPAVLFAAAFAFLPWLA